jgi:hypothetical protein
MPCQSNSRSVVTFVSGIALFCQSASWLTSRDFPVLRGLHRQEWTVYASNCAIALVRSTYINRSSRIIFQFDRPYGMAPWGLMTIDRQRKRVLSGLAEVKDTDTTSERSVLNSFESKAFCSE